MIDLITNVEMIFFYYNYATKYILMLLKPLLPAANGYSIYMDKRMSGMKEISMSFIAMHCNQFNNIWIDIF